MIEFARVVFGCMVCWWFRYCSEVNVGGLINDQILLKVILWYLGRVIEVSNNIFFMNGSALHDLNLKME